METSSKTFFVSAAYLVVTCTALASPAHGSWDRDDCRANSQKCRSICLLRCDTVNGFQLEGPGTRECLATGQWSTPWSSYCKGDLTIVFLFCYTVMFTWLRRTHPFPKITAPFNGMRTLKFNQQMRFSLHSIKCSATPCSFRLLPSTR